MSIDDTTLAKIEAALGKTGLYVDPSVAARVPVGLQTRLRQAIADCPTPVFVVVQKVGYDDTNYHGRPELLLGTIHSDTGKDGVYIGTDLNGEAPRLQTQSFGSAPDAATAGYAAELAHPDDLGKQLLTTLELVRTGKGEAAYTRLRDQQQGSSDQTATAQPHRPAGSGSSGSDDGGDALLGFAVIGTVIVVVAVLAARFGRRRARRGALPGSGHVTDRPFELPTSVLSTIRATRDRQLERRAQAQVLALGERIDATDLTPSGDASAWQAALDHYDLARRILDRKHSAADVVGSLVLAGRGQDALAAAISGSAYEPVRPCYLNPLHGPGVRRTRWAGPRGSAEVPMCLACARDVEAGREPRDVLDFVVRGKPRHYFDLDVEPWRSTGYGALEPDLLTRLFSER